MGFTQIKEFDLYQIEFIFRVLIAGICGIIVGAERKNRSKEAGVRTHFVVACGAALIMVISKYAFFDVITTGMFGDVEVRLDPSRVASTIASGIGFLGAGMIYVHKNTIIGLTTAAGIWATSGIGMAIGGGMYVLGIASTLIILIAQILLHINFHREKTVKLKQLIVKEVNEEGFQRRILEELQLIGIKVQETSIEKIEGNEARNYTFILEVPDNVIEDEIITLARYWASICNLP